MNKTERQGLANAVCAWLAYKELTGGRNILSEALLALPVSEFLSLKTGWQLTPELPYRKLNDVGSYPDFWCDFAAERKYGEGVRFILEAKYLKTKARRIARQIVADVVRLSMPSTKGLTRYFLLAGASQHFPNADEDFLFGKRMFGGRGFYIDPAQEVSKPEFLKAFPVFGDDRVARLVPRQAWLEPCADAAVDVEGDHSYRVMIWSVGRTKRS